MGRFLIDGMNVIGSRPDGWWNDRDRAINSFVEELADFARTTGDRLEVVFDRAPRPWRDPSEGAITVTFATGGGRNAADYEIERKVASDPDPSDLVVVSSDRRLVERVSELGARVTSSGSFRSRLEHEGKDRGGPL